MPNLTFRVRDRLGQEASVPVTVSVSRARPGITLPNSNSLDLALKAASRAAPSWSPREPTEASLVTYDASMEGAASPIQVEATGANCPAPGDARRPTSRSTGWSSKGLWNIRTSDTNQNLPTTKIPHDLLFPLSKPRRF